MYVKEKSYYLKKEIDPKILQEQFGFDEDYARKIGEYDWIKYYSNTGRFAIPVSFNSRIGDIHQTKKYLIDLIKADLVEIKYRWYWWVIIGKWQNYSSEKKQRIEKEIDRRNSLL